jgi:hypothetical protein
MARQLLIKPVLLLLLSSLVCGSALAGWINAKNRPLKDRIYGHAVGSDTVDLLRADTVEAYFVVNNVKDRVGISIEACVDPSGGTDRNCEDITFHFPELTFDRKTDEIILNGERVGRTGGSSENSVIYKPWALGYEVEKVVVDSGFDKYTKAKVKVYLGKEQAGSKSENQ